MKRGSLFLFFLIAIALLLTAGGVAYVGAKKFGLLEGPRKISLNPGGSNSRPSPNSANSSDSFNSGNASQAPVPASVVVGTSPSPASGAVTTSVYQQPQGKYSLTLPSNWLLNSTNATNTYSTSKFTGPNGNISITFGTGKDPAGGCSDYGTVYLADRTLSGCFLLQRDGSQLLTRVYTNDKAALPYTVEAYINSPLTVNKDVVLGIIRSIQIN